MIISEDSVVCLGPSNRSLGLQPRLGNIADESGQQVKIRHPFGQSRGYKPSLDLSQALLTVDFSGKIIRAAVSNAL